MSWAYMVSVGPGSEVEEAYTWIAMNMVIAFYAATFPGIVEDLPEVKSSEQEVFNGSRE